MIIYRENNERIYSLGRLSEGHEYLIKACKLYEEKGWIFEDEYDKNLAQNSISALEHVLKHTNINEGKNFLHNILNIRNKIKS